MKYKLIHFQIKEEHLCDKVTIDGFDYYVSDEIAGFTYNKPTYNSDGRIGLSENNQSRKVIATNNPNIDIPKVGDEEDIKECVALSVLKQEDWDTSVNLPFNQGFIKGYNKSQETHLFSLDDIKEIINLAREQYWDVDNRGFSSNTEGDWSFKYSTEEEIIQKYQETKILTIFYE